MLQLPNGCSCSTPSIYPSDWNKPGVSIKKDWYIQYYFIDPLDPKKEKCPNGRLKICKGGINRLKTAAERKAAVPLLLKELLHMLEKEGYNPITRKIVSAPSQEYEIHPSTQFSQALQKVFTKLVIAKSTKDDITSMLKHFNAAADQLRISIIPISDIRRRHIKGVLELVAKHRGFSPHRYNKYRSYLMMLFTELVELEVVESNIIHDMKILDTVSRLREVMTPEQCIMVDAHLRANYYSFWRFMYIFFQTGGRIKELLSLKVKDVYLGNQTYKTIINKGKRSREVLRAITDDIYPMWCELLKEADPEAYVFSVGLVPGIKDKPIRREQITRRWDVHVKAAPADGGLGITADFYALKHLFLEMIAKQYGINMSQGMADHTTPVVTMKHYATGQKGRDLDAKKKVKVSFTG